MPKNLTGQAIKSTYVQLLHVDGGVDAALKTITDGDGTDTPIKISTDETQFRKRIKVNRESGQLESMANFGDITAINNFGLIGVGITTPSFYNNNYVGVHSHGDTTGSGYRLTTRASGVGNVDGADLVLEQTGVLYLWNRENASFVIGVNNSAAVQLNPGATSWSAASDERLKDITGTYSNALQDLQKIKAIKYTWKSDATKKPNVGLSAQSVQEVIPEAVDSIQLRNGDKTDYLSVRYTEVIPLLVAAVQELTAEVAALRAKVG